MAKSEGKPIPEIGIHFGKTDLERVGFFAVLSYLHGRGYDPPITMPQIRDPKERQMLPGYPKVKTTGLQDCYFDKIFRRIFTGEAYYDAQRSYLRDRMEKAKQNRGLFRPSSYTHLHATPGDFFGCFTRAMRAFDPRTRPVPIKLITDPSKKILKFIPTSPGKKGGYGYKDITINPYPRYIPSPYDIRIVRERTEPNVKTVSWLPCSPPGLFQSRYSTDRVTYNWKVEAPWLPHGVFKPPNPAKSLGGCMEGCFSRWPTHSIDFYTDPWRIEKGQVKGAKAPPKGNERQMVWIPNGKGKSYATPSVMEMKVAISTNSKTWRTMQPITYTREFI